MVRLATMIAIAADHDVPDMPVVSAVARVGCGAKPVFRRGGADRCAGEYATPGHLHSADVSLA
jgi:hypothetical protein